VLAAAAAAVALAEGRAARAQQLVAPRVLAQLLRRRVAGRSVRDGLACLAPLAPLAAALRPPSLSIADVAVGVFRKLRVGIVFIRAVFIRTVLIVRAVATPEPSHRRKPTTERDDAPLLRQRSRVVGGM
jgi:hypothetical protein